MSPDLNMQTPGPAQLELIRRYARTLRELQSDAIRAQGPRRVSRDSRMRDEAARFTRGNPGAEQQGTPARPAPRAR
jgi:hypothetical protein